MMGSRRSVVTLAVSATATAICLSVLAGWQRGGTLPERLVWVAIGVVLVACAHLLPALAREAPPAVRGAATVLWMASLLTTSYGHLTYFLLAQQHAGELRAAALPVSESQPGRSLTVVMAQRANVTARLAAANAQHCTGSCPALEGRRAALVAMRDALDAEAGEIRRRIVAQDRAAERLDAVVADPVTARLAALLGTTATRVDLLSGLTFAAVLEGVACLMWALVTLRPSSPVVPVSPVAQSTPGEVAPFTTVTDVTQCTVMAEAVSHAVRPMPSVSAGTPQPSVTTRHGSVTEAVTPQASAAPVRHAGKEDDLTRLRQAIAAGELRPTVTGIRCHLGCSQARASALRRQLASLPDIS